MTGEPAAPARIVVMGVSACGKSTVGRALAERLGASFVDADDLHPSSNLHKMAAGVPLTDDDRWPWLDATAVRLAATGETTSVVVACSALKRAYRDRIRAGAPGTVFVHLTGSNTLLEERARARAGHFMPVSLLRSQLATLEDLEEDERGFALDTAGSVISLTDAAVAMLT